MTERRNSIFQAKVAQCVKVAWFLLYVPMLALANKNVEVFMKKIPLGNGKVALVDNCDYKYLSIHHWWEDHGYALRDKQIKGRNYKVYMHREILFPMKGEIDHADRNRLNNTRKNLRICEHWQNGKNQKGRATSGYKGVYRHPRRPKLWVSTINIRKNGETISKYVGCNEDKKIVARYYDYFARIYHKEFAVLNFPELPPLEPPSLTYRSNEKYVSYSKTRNKWISQIRFNRKIYSNGSYKTEEEAINDTRKRICELNESQLHRNSSVLRRSCM